MCALQRSRLPCKSFNVGGHVNAGVSDRKRPPLVGVYTACQKQLFHLFFQGPETGSFLPLSHTVRGGGKKTSILPLVFWTSGLLHGLLDLSRPLILDFWSFGPLIYWSLTPLVNWIEGQLNYWSLRPVIFEVYPSGPVMSLASRQTSDSYQYSNYIQKGIRHRNDFHHPQGRPVFIQYKRCYLAKGFRRTLQDCAIYTLSLT